MVVKVGEVDTGRGGGVVEGTVQGSADPRGASSGSGPRCGPVVGFRA